MPPETPAAALPPLPTWECAFCQQPTEAPATVCALCARRLQARHQCPASDTEVMWYPPCARCGGPLVALVRLGHDEQMLGYACLMCNARYRQAGRYLPYCPHCGQWAPPPDPGPLRHRWRFWRHVAQARRTSRS